MNTKNEYLDLVKIDPDTLGKVQLDKITGHPEMGTVKFYKDETKKYGLTVTAPITHSARLTRHRIMYQPREMRNGMKTFLMPFKKPVLINHKTGTTIGRVVGVDYVDMPHPLYDGPASLSSFEDTFDTIGKLVRSGAVYDSEFPGLGYINATLSITDENAIEKFLDERYMTFSIRTVTDGHFCPHCAKPFKPLSMLIGDKEHYEEEEDMYCQHGPMATVDDFPGFVVLAKQEFPEVSVVDIPADELAIVSSLENNQFADSSDNPAAGIYSVDGQITITDNVQVGESEEMGKNQDEKSQVTEQPTVTVFDFSTITDASSASEVYEAMSYILDEIAVEDGLESSDAKLSAEERKNLKGSQFCGPDRSFPVPDCAHVTAARRLIGRAKLSDSQKEKVLSCVNRKASQLGCDKSVKDSVLDSLSVMEDLSDFDALSVIQFVLEDAANRELFAQDLPVLEKLKFVQADNTEIEKELESAKLAKQAQADQIVELQKESKKHLAIANTLLNVFNDNLAFTSMNEHIDSALAEEYDTLKENVDNLITSDSIAAGIERFTSGCNPRVTVEPVANPTASSSVADSQAVEEDNSIETLIASRFNKLNADSTGQATAYLDSMVSQGYISSDFALKLTQPNDTEEE